jgi:hypothetical protein
MDLRFIYFKRFLPDVEFIIHCMVANQNKVNELILS